MSMARQINRLSPRAVASISRRGRYADGGGLYLQISAYDTKAWIYRFTLDGTARQMGLGPLHTVTLAEAREAAREYRRVRLACRHEGLSQREAARRFGIDRKSVAKMLAFSAPPGYRRSDPPKRPKLGPFNRSVQRI